MTQAFYNHLKLAQSEGRTIPGAKYKMSGDDKGSMNRKIFQFYIEDIFIPNLRDDELPAILFLDGHDSHFGVEVLEQLRKKGVWVVQLPSNLRYTLT